MKKSEKGFTLIEILAVIIILGVLLIIAVPSVSNYISDSRKSVYIDTAKSYIREVKKKVSSMEYYFDDSDTTYYVNIKSIPMDNAEGSPYGKWIEAYVIVTYTPDNIWNYYWASVDSAGMKVDVTKETDLSENSIYSSSKLYVNEQAPAGTRNNVEIYESNGEVIKTTQKIIADREVVDECYSYKLNESNHTASITYYNINCGVDLMIPSVIEDGNVQYTITEIYQYAFYNMRINSVIIPKSVTTIGTRAFASNPLTRVVLPEGLKKIDSEAFLSCQLPEVNLPNTLTTIGQRAFRKNKISSVVIPDSVTSLGSCAFCDNPIPNPSFLYVTNNGVPDYSRIRGYMGDLSEFTDKKFIIPAEVNGVALTTIESSAFSRMSLSGWEVIIPSTVTSIGSSAFWDSGIAKVNLPNGLKTIGSTAFFVNNLKTIDIPSTVTSIGERAFSRNAATESKYMWIYNRNSDGSINYSSINSYAGSNRKNITIPPTAGPSNTPLKTLGRSCFYEINLTGTIKIPSTVTSIGELAFANNQLTSVDNGDGNTSTAIVYARNSDATINYSKIMSYGGYQTANVVIPNTVTEIANYGFFRSYIKGVTIPSSVKKIGNYAFQLCRLIEVTIPSSISTIGTGAFSKSITWTSSNGGLVKIINKTGKSFNWQAITSGPSAASFKTGTVENWYGDIVVSDN